MLRETGREERERWKERHGRRGRDGWTGRGGRRGLGERGWEVSVGGEIGGWEGSRLGLWGVRGELGGKEFDTTIPTRIYLVQFCKTRCSIFRLHFSGIAYIQS